jgi:ATP-dependent Clp protease adaptor protein ClpS
MDFKELVLDDVEKIAQDLTVYKLILYNDDFNTFEWVIGSLVEVCDHTLEQAEQTSLIVHYKGKCQVKSGTWEVLEPQCHQLLERGLSAKIE